MNKAAQAQHSGSPDAAVLPDIDWIEAGKQLWKESGDDHLALVASGIAFNAFLAFVPFLTSVVLTYGIVASPEQVASHISALTDVLPKQAAKIVGSELHHTVSRAGAANGLGLFVTLGISLYGALRGATGIISGLNIVFEVEESRSFLWQTLVAVAITLGLVVTFLFASAGISLVAFLTAIVPNIGGVVDSVIQIGYWIAAAAAVSVVIALIYRYAPNRQDTAWQWLTAGSVVATGIWLVGTWVFGFYVRNFGSFGAIYGALGAIIIFLLWLYISAYILLLGAELNQVLAGKGLGDGEEDAKDGGREKLGGNS